MKRYCLTLKLKADKDLIAEYIEYHREGRPEIHASIRDAGIVDMQIFELSGLLFMIMDTEDDFSFERKAALDAANPKVQEWEKLMERFQDVGEGADFDAKWKLMEKIFQLR